MRIDNLGETVGRFRWLAVRSLIPTLALILVLAGCKGEEAEEIEELPVLNERAVALHRQRRLAEASALYAQVLESEPSRKPTQEEQALALRHAPRLFVTQEESLLLKASAAVLHPGRPLIAYHLFWEDDIDHPDDNDPCDHEVVWVAYDTTSGDVTGVHAYYHGRILTSDTAVTDANAHGGRPWVGVQWGKHGSLVAGWEKIQGESIWLDMRGTYLRLHEQGPDQRDHPLAQGWPQRFEGSWDDFVDFSQPVELREWLASQGMMVVSRWPNAVIDRRFLRYNFYPKPEWPEGERADGPIGKRLELVRRAVGFSNLEGASE
jgi:hypothetical protein